MNRIILIGNGFDLAHGLRTSYTHFIDNYWKRKSDLISKKNSHEYEDNDIWIRITEGKSFLEEWGFSSEKIQTYSDFKKHMYHVHDLMKRGMVNAWNYFTYYNKFLEKITDKSDLDNWVDIEEEYYTMLKECFDNKGNIYHLNQDFDRIKKALETYLIEDVNDKLEDFSIDFPCRDIVEKIYSDFKKDDFAECAKDIDLGLSPNSILFLNFNYTSTIHFYSENDIINRFLNNKPQPKVESIYIHGKLGAKNNPIIFGYGDEMDYYYRHIKNLNNKSYYENMKNFKYLETDNNKKLQTYLNSDYYQVFIFGHSCGNSDRTLLSSLFRHDNCVSIKPFYYINKWGEDNFSDLTRNISQHFTDDKVMRDKVVNKTYCEPLMR